MSDNKVDLGEFEYERATQNTFVYVQDNGGKYPNKQYVKKADLNVEVAPKKVRFLLEF